MPEGDTIFRTASVLRSALAGQCVTDVSTSVRQILLRAPRRLVGQEIADVQPRGKHLLCWFAPSDLALHTHMGMSGSWHVYRPGERWRKPAHLARITLTTPDVAAVCFLPQVCRLLARGEVEGDPRLRALGPDALDEAFDLEQARRRLDAREDQAIADALLDQRVLAGVGNVYKSEVLFAVAVDPWARVADLAGETRDAVLRTAVELLRAGAAPGGRRPAWVYGRAGQPCRRCGRQIRAARQGEHARVTYWCPRCQGGGPSQC